MESRRGFHGKAFHQAGGLSDGLFAPLFKGGWGDFHQPRYKPIVGVASPKGESCLYFQTSSSDRFQSISTIIWIFLTQNTRSVDRKIWFLIINQSCLKKVVLKSPFARGIRGISIKPIAHIHISKRIDYDC
jgi:hypothetical protein